jgi:hypothetical protein
MAASSSCNYQESSSAAEIRLIPDLLVEPQVNGKLVRIIGTVTSIDRASRICMMEHRGCSACVDISLINASDVRIDDIFQFIGEVNQCFNSEVHQRAFLLVRP